MKNLRFFLSFGYLLASLFQLFGQTNQDSSFSISDNFENYIIRSEELKIASLDRVFPEVKFFVETSKITMPHSQRIVGVLNEKNYFMPEEFNLLFNEVSNDSKTSIEEKIDAFVLLSFWLQDNKLKIISNKSIFQKTGDYELNRKVEMIIGNKNYEVLLLYKDGEIVRAETFIDSQKRSLITPLLLNVGPVDLSIEGNMVRVDNDNRYTYYYISVSENGTATNYSVQFNISGLQPNQSNVRLQVKPIYGFGGNMFLDQELTVTTDGTAFYNWIPPNNFNTGICEVQLMIDIQPITFNNIRFMPEKILTGNFNAGYDYIIYYTDQFFWFHPNSITHSLAFANNCQISLNQSWDDQVNNWQLANGLANNQPEDNDNLYELCINDGVSTHKYHRTTTSQAFGGGSRVIGIESTLHYFRFPEYSTEEVLIDIATGHEFYHGIQWGHNQWQGGDWLTEGQARFLQTVINENEEFQSMRMYPEDANNYLQTNLNTSLLHISYRYCIYWRFLFENYLSGSTQVKLAIFREICREVNSNTIPNIENAINSALDAGNGIYNSFDNSLKEFAKANYILTLNDSDPNQAYDHPEIYDDIIPRREVTFTGIEDTILGVIPISFGTDFIEISISEMPLEYDSILIHFDGGYINGGMGDGDDQDEFYVQLIHSNNGNFIDSHSFELDDNEEGRFNLSSIISDVDDKIGIIITRLDNKDGNLTNAPGDYRIDVFSGPTWHVSTTGNDSTGIGNKTYPFASIQVGINLSAELDTVLVDDGTYVGELNRNLSFKGKNITLKSKNGSQYSTLDCEGSGYTFLFMDGEDTTSLIKGFSIQSSSSPLFGHHGSIYIIDSSPRFVDCSIVHYGGLVCAGNASPIFEHCKFILTSKFPGYHSQDSGALCIDNSHPVFKSCTFSNWLYGGVKCTMNTKAEFYDCIVSNNKIFSGGIVISSTSIVTVERCQIFGNENIFNGGGISVSGPSIIRNCQIFSNTGSGGGIGCNGSPGTTYTTLIEKCLIYNNLGINLGIGGILCELWSKTLINNCIIANNIGSRTGGIGIDGLSFAKIKHSTIVGNIITNTGSGAGGISCDNSMYITNSIIYGNRHITNSPNGCKSIWWYKPGCPGICDYCNDPVLSLNSTDLDTLEGINHSLIGGGYPGVGNFDADPAFVDTANGDFHLQPWSPAIDAGDPTSEYGLEPQPNGERINIGAYGNTLEATVSVPIATSLPDTLDFGEVQTGQTDTLHTIIKNIGHDSLQIFSIASDDPAFTVLNPSAQSVLGIGDSLLIYVAFQPDASGVYFSKLVITSDSPPPYDNVNVILEGNANSSNLFSRITNGDIVNDGGVSYGCSWGDYNNDGYPDLFVSDLTHNNLLYHNNGDGSFTNITDGIIVNDSTGSLGSSWGDFDNDGYLDLFTANWNNVNNFLYHNNGDGSFSKITTGPVVHDGGNSFGGSWGDFDSDGDLDLFVFNDLNQNNFLYRNLLIETGNPDFEKITSGEIVNDGGDSWGCGWADYDNDGDLDLFVANANYQNNFLYKNQLAETGNPEFLKINSGHIVNDGAWSTGCSWGDYDNDGDLDLFVANGAGNNFLYRNETGGLFTRITEGSIVTDPASSKGSVWSDFDNDGDLDIFIANSPYDNYFYTNNGNGSFSKIVTGDMVNDGGNSFGCSASDYDKDGDTDLFVANFLQNNFLYENTGNNNNWINIKLVGKVSNESAIGAKIKLKAKIKGTLVSQINEISSLTGYPAQNDFNAEFGLGNAFLIDSILIQWPSGVIQQLSNVSANQFISITELVDINQFQKTISDGWNLIGLPLKVENGYYRSLFPNAMEGTLYDFNGTYQSQDTLEDGKGYWLKFPSSESVQVLGTPIVSDTIVLQSGWNMISGASCNIPLSEVYDPGNIIIPGTLYGFNGTYYTTDSIKQGNGYWIKANSPGLIIVSCNILYNHSLANQIIQSNKFNGEKSINISDMLGNSQTLYFDVTLQTSEFLEHYSFPPIPPLGIFDARFSGGYWLSEEEEPLIDIRAAKYPLIVNVSNISPEINIQYSINEIVGDRIIASHALQEGKVVNIQNPEVNKLKITKIETIPTEFTVYQNYPNPFNPITTIDYTIPQKEEVSIIIFNTLGQKVKTLVSRTQVQGRYKIIWDSTNDSGKKVSSGIYFYEVRSGDKVTARKMLLLR